MLIYLTFTGLALFLTAKAIIGLFRDRFPHPVDLAIVSTAYYGIPLSLAGYFDWSLNHMAFLAPFAADQGLAALSMRFVLLALLALVFGRYLARRMASPTVLWFGKANTFAVERVRFALLGLIGLIILGVYLFGVRNFLAGYASDYASVSGETGNAVVYATLEFMGLAIAYAMILGQSTGRTPGKFLMVVCVVISLVVLALRAKRLEVISVFIPPLLVFISRRESISSFSWRVIAGTALLSLLVVISIIRVSDNYTLQQAIFLIFSEGLYAGHSMPGILERLDTQTLNYEYGARYISSLFGFVPRFLWEGKDDLVYAGNVALEGVAPLGATNLLAEVVLQGGIVAVALSYTVIGFLFERFARFEDVWDKSLEAGIIPARFGAYVIAIAVFVPHFRDGIIPSIKLSLQATIFFLVLVGMRRMSTFSTIKGPALNANPTEIETAVMHS